MPNIVLNWLAPTVTVPDFYRVYGGAKGAETLTADHVTQTTFTVQPTPPGSTSYFVTAVYGATESGPSNEITLSLVISPNAPTFGQTTTNQGNLPVNTQALTTGATSEVVQVAADASFTNPVAGSPLAVPTPGAAVIAGGLISGQVYYARLGMVGSDVTVYGPAASLVFDTTGPQIISAEIDRGGTRLVIYWGEASPPVTQVDASSLLLAASGGAVTLSGVVTRGIMTSAILSRTILAADIVTLSSAAGAFRDAASTGSNPNDAFAGAAVINRSIQQQRSSSMARAYNLQGVYVSPELSTAPGTIVTPAKRFPNFELMTKPSIPNKAVKYPGSKATTAMQIGQQQSDATYNAAADYNLLTYIYCSLLGMPAAPTALGGGAFQWNWLVLPTLPLPAPQTYSVDQGSVHGGERFGYGVFSAMQMKWSEQDAALSGNMFGQQVIRDIAPNMLIVTNAANVTELPVVAIMPQSVGTYLSVDGGATFTRMQKDMDGELRINNAWKPVYHVNDLNASFDDVAEQMPDMGLTLTVEEGSEADTFMSRLYAGQMVYAGCKSVGPTIGTVSGTKISYMHKVNLPTFVSKPDPGDKSGVFGNTFTFDVGHDNTFGLAQITLINTLATL